LNVTPRLGLPFIAAGQAQKDLRHNEALQLLDMLVAPAVEALPANAAPATPPIGSCYLVGNDPSGDWAGEANAIAGYSDGGWRFASMAEGAVVYVRSEDLFATYRDGDWEVGAVRGAGLLIGGDQVVGQRQPAIADAGGGQTIDSEAREAIAAILSALRGHGLIET
jgi:hypothetical protein